MSYFASQPIADLLPELKQKTEEFHKYKERTGEAARWRKAYNLYYGKHVESGNNIDVSHVGEDGELTAYGVNFYRNFVKHMLAITCSTKPTYDFKAKNSDLKSQQQARTANNIIDSYLTEKRMGRHMKQAAERALVFSLGYTYTTWDPTLGKAVKALPVLDEQGQQKLDEDQQPILKIKYEGDPTIVSKSPWDVIHSVSLRDWARCKWTIVKEYENKYDLAAQYPKFAEEIEKVSGDEDAFTKNYTNILRSNQEDDEDLIPVYHFYHLKTDSLKSGRYTKYIANDIALYDGPYPYRSALPVQRITPGEMFDTVNGYSEFNDLLVLQQVLNLNYSTVLTNQEAFGVQALWVPGDCELSSEQIGPMRLLKGGMPGSKPEAINFTATPAEVFKNGDVIKNAMQELSGLNDAVTGSNENDMSGVALGRMQAMAIQFSSNFQQSWAEIQEDCGTFMLHLLQDFADSERMTSIAGKSSKGAMMAWKKEDIAGVDRVTCDLGNPMFRTYAGRTDLADKLLEKGLVKDPNQYITVIETGTIEPLFESPLSKRELIRRENEMLMDGKSCVAMVGDEHIAHSQEHLVILHDPQIRSMAEQGDQLAMQIVENVQNHIMQHNQLQNTQDPFWFVVSGEQPPPPPMMPPPPGPNGPPPGPPPQEDPNQGAPPMGPGPQVPEPPAPPPLPPEVQ
jgi:hypothetical protein